MISTIINAQSVVPSVEPMSRSTPGAISVGCGVGEGGCVVRVGMKNAPRMVNPIIKAL